MKKSYNLRLCYFGLLCRKFFITAFSRAKRVSRKVLKENCIKECEGNEQLLATYKRLDKTSGLKADSYYDKERDGYVIVHKGIPEFHSAIAGL